MVMEQASRGRLWQRTFPMVGIVSSFLSIWMIPAGFPGITPQLARLDDCWRPGLRIHRRLECCSEEG